MQETAESVDALVARIDALEAEVQALRAERPQPKPPADDDGHAPVSRRRLIGMAGTAAIGAVGAVVAGASPAGADDPDDVTIDASKAGTGSTRLDSSVAAGPTLQINNTSSGTGLVAGSATGNSLALNAPTANNAGTQLLMTPGSASGPPTAGAHEVGQFWMDSTGRLFQCTVAGPPGTWAQIPQLGRDQVVVPTTSTRLATSGSQNGWWVASNGSGTAIVGQSTGGTGVAGTTDAGIALQGNVNVASSGVQLALLPTSQVGPPTIGLHDLGQFVVDQNGVLFQCVVAGSPGIWARQSSLVTLASPFRVYDSRASQPNPSNSTQGTLDVGGGARVINCTPTPNIAGATLPAGTAAILFNVTLANMVGPAGSVVVWANGATEPTTSSINWSAGQATIANAVTSACDASQDVQIKCTTGVSTNVIMDVIGFYI